MGDGGAAPMEVEMGEDDARNPTALFFIKGERRGTQCFEWTSKCCIGKFVGRLHKLAVHIAGCKGCRSCDLVENVGFKLLP